MQEKFKDFQILHGLSLIHIFNGDILHIDLAPVKELISLQRRCSNNLNQVAIHAHTYGVYP